MLRGSKEDLYLKCKRVTHTADILYTERERERSEDMKKYRLG